MDVRAHGLGGSTLRGEIAALIAFVSIARIGGLKTFILFTWGLRPRLYVQRLQLRGLFVQSLILFTLFLVLSENSSSAQETLRINSGSAIYDIVVEIVQCDEEGKRSNLCSGPGRVSIYRKGSSFPFQVLSLKNIDVNKDQLAYNPEINKNTRKLYDDEYSFIFGDFNFDANEDLAVCNGRNGGYGAPSYTVFLYNSMSKKFIENVNLSKLTEGYLGLFFVDPKKRQLVAHSKSGCCYHETEVYKVIRNKPVMVEKIIEEATGNDARGYVVTVTTRKLVNGRWVKRVRKKKLKEETP